jgi:pyruvate/2-oxoglutarate dehydrogenase complex dihydrolipoamide acyltransferase (E2) component
MPIIDISVPQLGEGLQEVIVRQLLKAPGDTVRRNETIYAAETDKATMDIEASFDGILERWLVKENDVLSIGSPIARMIVQEATEAIEANTPDCRTALAKSAAAMNSQRFPPVSAPTIPPRTRAYARSLGLADQEIELIPAPAGKVMPEDVDLYLDKKKRTSSAAIDTETHCLNYQEHPLSQPQRALLARLKRGAQQAVPGTIGRFTEWGRIQDFVKELKSTRPNIDASVFQVFSYCVAQATRRHPKFRSSLRGESTVREYQSVNLGIAIARPNDELITAVVQAAGTLSFSDYLTAFKRQLLQAMRNGDQATESAQLILSYLGSHEIIDATPTLVTPAIAVLFIGSPIEYDNRLVTKLSLTFDHRLINGVGAAAFLSEIDKQIDTLISKGIEVW